MTTETALVSQQEAALGLPSPEQLSHALKAIRQFQAICKTEMVEGHDYGVIPGTERPTLLKPGAEKIAKILGLADTYEILERQEDWERPFFRYLIRCTLTMATSGMVISQGLGECNMWEAKYRWRWVTKAKLPLGIDSAVLPRRMMKNRTTGGEFLVYRVENDDPYSQVNTLVKMAKKRALVDAALSAGRLSDVFTQDMEERATEEPSTDIPTERVDAPGATPQPQQQRPAPPQGRAVLSGFAGARPRQEPPPEPSSLLDHEPQGSRLARLQTTVKWTTAQLNAWAATAPAQAILQRQPFAGLAPFDQSRFCDLLEAHLREIGLLKDAKEERSIQ